MSMIGCGKPDQHRTKRLRLLEAFGKAPAGTIVDADACPECGVYVRSKQLGLDDEGSWMIPAALAEPVEQAE